MVTLRHETCIYSLSNLNSREREREPTKETDRYCRRRRRRVQWEINTLDRPPNMHIASSLLWPSYPRCFLPLLFPPLATSITQHQFPMTTTSSRDFFYAVKNKIYDCSFLFQTNVRLVCDWLEQLTRLLGLFRPRWWFKIASLSRIRAEPLFFGKEVHAACVSTNETCFCFFNFGL